MWVTFSSHCLSFQRVMYKAFFPAEQSLAKWSLLTTLTWHWHGDVFKISRNLLFGVFVYATAAPPLYSPSGCPPFLVVSEKKTAWKAYILRFSCPCCVQPNVLDIYLINWKGGHRLKKWPFHPILCDLVYCWPVNIMYILHYT